MFALSFQRSCVIGVKLAACAMCVGIFTVQASAYGSVTFVSGCPTVVTNTVDGGPGSLRQAMTCANNNSGPDAIVFNIPLSDPGFNGSVFVIKPVAGGLPPLVDNATTIDGTTQTAFTGNTNTAGPEVMLLGNPAVFFGSGIRINSASNVVTGLVVSGFDVDAINMTGASATGNRVSGCYIGTDPSGNAAVPNVLDGVVLASGASGNIVGGVTPQDRNVISGNTRFGVLVYGVGGSPTGNVIQGNYIGVNASGTLAIGNDQGVVFISANSNVLGGTTVGAGNVISGNLHEAIHSQSSSGQTIQGNYIGTDVTGSVAVANGGNGINMFTGASPSAGNLIGGSLPGAGNVISGNSGNGIFIGGAGSDNNVIQGNLVGTDRTGMLPLANSGDGVGVGSANNVIGGTAPGARNVISGNSGDSELVIFGPSAGGNRIQGNYIGTNAAGTAAIPNANPASVGLGVFGTPNNLIGGTLPGAGNLISGNGDTGVAIGGLAGTGNQVQGNFIGTDILGAAAVPNFVGIFISSGQNTIGGNSPAARNLVSGNALFGIQIFSANAVQNTVQGNYVGTDATGNGAGVGNEGTGLIVNGGASLNQIGGTTAGSGNVFSGNGEHGIQIRGVGTTNNTIQGNFVGTNATGSAGIPNKADGIRFDRGTSFDVVGGTVPGARNLISSNKGHGIHIDNFSTTPNTPGPGTGHITVQGNFIGTDVSGTGPLGNSLPGVIVFAGASDNLIGGTVAGAGNVVAFTTGATVDDGNGGFVTLPGSGISIANDGNTTGDAGGNSSLRNRIAQNSVFANNGLGIDLSALGIMPDPTQGPTQNDACDADAGGNSYQNFPVLTSFFQGGGNVTVTGTLNATANTVYRIEFFSDSVSDPSGYGEGSFYLGFTNITTDGFCNAAFSFTGTFVPGQNIVTATATDPDGNTSEFSLAKQLANPDDDNDGVPNSCDIDQHPAAIDFDHDGIIDGSPCDPVIGPPTNKDQCKNGGWQYWTRGDGTKFKNQGDCVSFTNTGR
jgi:hypothetical protein